MYAIALSVSACLRAQTRVDVAWIIETQGFAGRDRTGALAITPGGGRVGSLLSGSIDGQLVDLAGRQGATGRVVKLDISAVDVAALGIVNSSDTHCIIVPASELPTELWQLLIAREPVCLVSHVNGNAITSTSLFTSSTITDADESVAKMFARGVGDTAVTADTVVTVWWPVPKLVIVGGGAITDALRDAAALLGWQTVIATDINSATGAIAGLSAFDSVVVTGHDLEITGGALLVALSSNVGYIGALGSHQMQQTRADWLAYREFVDLERVHGPAGLDIGAKTPAEIAVSILAEALAVNKAVTQ